jgi:hypothetical protein
MRQNVPSSCNPKHQQQCGWDIKRARHSRVQEAVPAWEIIPPSSISSTGTVQTLYFELARCSHVAQRDASLKQSSVWFLTFIFDFVERRAQPFDFSTYILQCTFYLRHARSRSAASTLTTVAVSCYRILSRRSPHEHMHIRSSWSNATGSILDV